MMEQDAELEAMGVVYNTLMRLDDDAKQRVIQWAANRLSLSVPGVGPSKGVRSAADTPSQKTVSLGGFESVADVFAAAAPDKDKDKALVVAAFLQEKFQKAELMGYDINKELKHLGHGLSNVTDAINQLMSMNPKLMIQIRKEGKTKQAKKKYRVTTEGFKAVNQLLNPLPE